MEVLSYIACKLDKISNIEGRVKTCPHVKRVGNDYFPTQEGLCLIYAETLEGDRLIYCEDCFPPYKMFWED